MNAFDLVTAIINKDAVGTETAFNSVMADKISARIEDLRTDMAQSMFNETEIVSEEQIDEIDRNKLYHNLRASEAAKNKDYSSSPDYSKADKAAKAAKIGSIRKTQRVIGKLTTQHGTGKPFIKPAE